MVSFCKDDPRCNSNFGVEPSLEVAFPNFCDNPLLKLNLLKNYEHPGYWK